MTNQINSPEGSTPIPVQVKPVSPDVLEIHRDTLQVIHRPDLKIWTPDGPVPTREHADKVSDDFNRFIGKSAHIR
jgi:hypothetical protein